MCSQTRTAQGAEAAMLRKSTQEINGRLEGAERKTWGVQYPFYASVTIRHVRRLSVVWTDLKRRCQGFPFNLRYLVRTLVIFIKTQAPDICNAFIFVFSAFTEAVILVRSE